ncbi:AAA family ATPase [Actinoplanes sp. NPDC023936]|uniref:ATP-binding protein n=1 Tax=Actinoplanes sp. NPDC023936 TaxID=3154910 RepID=UPI0033FE6639
METRKVVTALRCGIDGYQELSESLDPEILKELMNVFLEDAGRVLDRYGATVLPSSGGVILAVFGVPRVHSDDALRAVRAALDLVSDLRGRNDAFHRAWRTRLSPRIGIGTGTVVAADPVDGQMAVAGDALNLAARLERAARPGDILISDATHAFVRDSSTVEPTAPASPTGRQAPIHALRLLGLRGPRERAPHLDAPMVGREQEQALLQQVFERAVSNRTCQLFTVLGDAGVGKSRLVREFASALAGGATVVTGRCLPYGKGITFWPVAEMVRQAADLHVEETATTARAKLLDALGALGGQESARSVADHLLCVLGLSDTAAPLEQILWSVSRFLESLARREPLVVIFDDLQWAEPTFLDLVDHVAEWSGEVPLLILCLARPELLENRPAWGGGKTNATSILLDALSRDESARLVGHLLDYTPVARDTWNRIGDTAAGNPLVLEQLLGMLLDEGTLRRVDGEWSIADRTTPTIPLPPSIQAILAERLERLPRSAQALAQRAGVVGRVFYRGAVVELTDPEARAGVEANLLALTRKGFINTATSELLDDDTFRFRHMAIRDAAYESLPKSQRWALHERFARWVQDRLQGGDRNIDELVGYHLEQAYRYRFELNLLDRHSRELAVEAAARLGEAGRRAFGLGDLCAAATLLTRTVALLPDDDPEKLEAQALLGRVLRCAGQFPQAQAVVSDLIAGAAAAGDERLRAQGLVEQAFIQLYTDPEGRTEDAMACAGQAIEVFERIGDHRNLAEVWNLLGVVHLMRSDMTARQEALEQALDYAHRSGDTRNEAWIIWGIIGSMAQGAIPAIDAAAYAQDQLDLARTKGWRLLEAGASLHLGRLRAFLGRFREALAHVVQARRLCEELGLPLWAASTWQYSGMVESLAGDWTSAERHFRRGYEALGRLGEQTYRLTGAAYLAEALYHLDRFDEAVELTDEIKENAASDDVHTQVLWRGTSAKVLARGGDSFRSVALAEEAVALSHTINDPNVRADALFDLAECRGLAGLPIEATQAATEALALYRDKGNVVKARECRGFVDDQRSALDPANAMEESDEHPDDFAESGQVPDSREREDADR